MLMLLRFRVALIIALVKFGLGADCAPATADVGVADATNEETPEHTRLSAAFVSLWQQRKVDAARDVVAKMLADFKRRDIPDERYDVRATRAWQHELDVLVALDEAERNLFFDSLERIHEIYIRALRSPVDQATENEIVQLVGSLPKNLDFDCPSRLMVVEKLAYLRSVRGDYATARALYLQVKNSYAKTTGTDDPVYASVCEQLGACALELRSLDEAESNFKECLSIVAKLGGENSPSVVRAQSNLAIIDVDRKQYPEAIKKLNSVVEKTKDVVGMSLVFAASQYQLGIVYTETMQWASAEQAFRAAIERYRPYPFDFGPNLLAVRGLANLYDKSGQTDKAEAFRDEMRNAKTDRLPGPK